MSEFEIRARIDHIQALSENDQEAAHYEEGKLRGDFIKYIASGADDARRMDLVELANLVLSTDKIEFGRWYA